MPGVWGQIDLTQTRRHNPPGRENQVRFIKMLGLAAVAAVAAMAFVGASSAMAESTLLCTADEPAACNAPATVHFIDPAATLLTTAPVLTITCEALISGTPGVLGAPQKVSVAAGGLTYSNCNNSCTAVNEASGVINVLKSGHEAAKITGEGFLVHLKCGAAINCFYNAEGLEGSALGPLLTADGKTHVTTTAAAVHKVKGLCPSTALLDSLFISLDPQIYIRG
jgi:hypothetical protein